MVGLNYQVIRRCRRFEDRPEETLINSENAEAGQDFG
jgi:hypothetical protein